MKKLFKKLPEISGKIRINFSEGNFRTHNPSLGFHVVFVIVKYWITVYLPFIFLFYTCKCVFSSVGWVNSITGQKLSVCLCVNQGGTNHNRCTQRLVILLGDWTFPPIRFPWTFSGRFPHVINFSPNIFPLCICPQTLHIWIIPTVIPSRTILGTFPQWTISHGHFPSGQFLYIFPHGYLPQTFPHQTVCPHTFLWIFRPRQLPPDIWPDNSPNMPPDRFPKYFPLPNLCAVSWAS